MDEFRREEDKKKMEWESGQKGDKEEEEEDVGIQVGWTEKERVRERKREEEKIKSIGVFARGGAMARQLGGGGGGGRQGLQACGHDKTISPEGGKQSSFCLVKKTQAQSS